MRSPVQLTVNGSRYELDIPADTPLLYGLRNDLGLNGPKFGCGLGECGACTVLIDGVAARSCVIPVGGLAGRAVTTLEGLSQNEILHPVQAAFVAEQGAQCGYCLNGMVMTAAALLARRPDATRDEIAHELRYNLCRCGTHIEIMRAVLLAAGRPEPRPGDTA